MFDRIYGEDRLREALGAWAEAGEAGDFPPLKALKQYLLTCSKAERSLSLVRYLNEPPEYVNVMAAFMLLWLDCDASARQAATEYLLNWSRERVEVEVTALWLCANLTVLPMEFCVPIEHALNSDSDLRRVIAASAALKLPEEAESSPHRALGILRLAVDTDDGTLEPAIRLRAAVGVARSRVNIVEIADTLVRFLEDAAETEQLEIVVNLNSSFEHEENLVQFLVDSVRNPNRTNDLRASMLRMLGHVCPSRGDIRDTLLAALHEESEWDLRLAAALGLANQSLPFPGAAVSVLLIALELGDDELRTASAAVLLDAARWLTEENLELVADRLESEPKDEIREILLRCLAQGPAAGIGVGLRRIRTGSNLANAMWAGILAETCSRHPDAVLAAFERERDVRVDELIPVILSRASQLSDAVMERLREALRSPRAVERHNALTVLENAQEGAAAATPELVDLYLYGALEERQRAEAILFRLDRRTHPYLRAYDGIRGGNALERFQRLERIVGVSEVNVRDVALWHVRNVMWIRVFVAVGEIIEEHGPMGTLRLEQLLEEQKKAGTLPEKASVGASTIRRHFDELGATIARFDARAADENLFCGKERQPKELTDYGKEWLDRCRCYLRIIDAEV